MDLIRWCKGAVINGVVWSPERQAAGLVEEARETWENGWPDRGGTQQLRSLFQCKYAPPQKEIAPLGRAELIEQGKLARPCVLCDPRYDYCEYGGVKGHQLALKEEAEREDVERRIAATETKPRLERKPLTQFDVDRILRDGQHLWEQEQQRKREQLERLGIDDPPKPD
jgi:hypothetical protein